MSALAVPRLIERKRDGGELADGEWQALIREYVGGRVPDYQMAALAMAIVFRGLGDRELVALTGAMIDSGARFELDDLPGRIVDKHSIGGVGDKTSLLVAPIIAAVGGAFVPMIAGRGLGHTGGTLDKLESIPCFRADLSLREARAQLERIGIVMMGQTEELVPADRKLYALRDVTGTVESIPLISASIMSKKLAEGLDALVLDIKTGSGAFITDPSASLELANTMIGLGEARGCRTVALLTAMDRPLGIACGNAIEVAEAIAGLRGQGPPDLMAVTFALGAEMLVAGGVAPDRDHARAAVERVVASGAALERFGEMVEAQGGSRVVIDHPDRLPTAPHRESVNAPTNGIIGRVEPRGIGHAIIALGGGRSRADEAIDPAVGIEVFVKPGESVRVGDRLAEIHARDRGSATDAAEAVRAAIPIVDREPSPLPLISHRVTKDGIEALYPS